MKKRTVYSQALTDRIILLLEAGLYVKQVADEVGCNRSTIRKWAAKYEDFGLRYHVAYATGWLDRIETSLIRLADASRDKGRLANAMVTRDTNLCRATLQAAQVTCPKEFGSRVNVEHSGVTTKRIIIVEKFDGATIGRIQRN